MTPGKTLALTRWTFVGKVISLLFNMLSRLVIIFLPRSKCLLISFLVLNESADSRTEFGDHVDLGGAGPQDVQGQEFHDAHDDFAFPDRKGDTALQSEAAQGMSHEI